MTAEELVGRISAGEVGLWEAEDYLRDEDRRDAALEARAKAAVANATR